LLHEFSIAPTWSIGYDVVVWLIQPFDARRRSVMSNVGNLIRKRREELQWTQDKLASEAGISKSFLSDVENSKRNVGSDKLLDIARALSLSNLSLAQLMTGEPGGQTEQQPEMQMPASLINFASERGISVKEALMLLRMQNQIIALRSSVKKSPLEDVDWQKFYEAVKDFLL
jgi:transcriptional regulator with XRE-family HTH domain